MDRLDRVFSHLNSWRHLPNYQLERRADILFSVYLADVVREFTGHKIDPRIVPEFPVKRDLIWPDLPTSKSVKIDYVLFTADRSRGYLVELKTDRSSRRPAQDHYLGKAASLGLPKLLKGLVTIAQETKAYRKYYHLLHLLAEMGFLRLPDGIETYLYPRARQGLTPKLREIRVEPIVPTLEVIYVQPEAMEEGGLARCIDFAFFGAYLDGLSDPLSAGFRRSLEAWTTRAGAVPPSLSGE